MFYPYFEAGETLEKIASKFSLSVSNVCEHRKKWKESVKKNEIAKVLDVDPVLITFTDENEIRYPKKNGRKVSEFTTVELLNLVLRKKSLARIKVYSIIARVEIKKGLVQ